jgi:hypothetical protein
MSNKPKAKRYATELVKAKRLLADQAKELTRLRGENLVLRKKLGAMAR